MADGFEPSMFMAAMRVVVSDSLLSSVVAIGQDQYGNYVVQRAICVGEGQVCSKSCLVG